VLRRCRRRFGLEAPVVEAGLADTGVAFGVWPGNRFVALDGDEEGWWFGFTELPFVCTKGTEGFFILLDAPADLEATTAAIWAETALPAHRPLEIAPTSFATAAIARF
jgi:hypothetical protein